MSGETLELAFRLLHRGYAVIDVPFRSKNPGRDDWQKERWTAEQLPSRFDGVPKNIGVLVGSPSGGRVDVDLDAPEVLALADLILAPTNARFGRAAKPNSHRVYLADPCPEAVERFRDVDARRTTLVELRSDGGQTIFPGSVHPSGEPIGWVQDGEPAVIHGHILRAQVAQLAAGALIARHWPPPPARDESGTRHDLSLALAGGLLRSGWTDDDAAEFITAVAQVAGDEEARARGANVRTTARRLAGTESKKATGWPTFARLIGQDVADKVCEWLGVERGATVEFDWSTVCEESEEGEESQPRSAAQGSGPDLSSLSSLSSHSGAGEAPWPDPLEPEALYGLAGDVVRTTSPHTEADPAAILAHFLAGAGVMLGMATRAVVGDAQHPPKLNALVIGPTSKGRKGTAQRATERVLTLADGALAANIVEGMSSGEGLIWQVRDPIYKRKKVGKSANATYAEVLADPGVEDKRLLVIESEFATALRVMQREGNTLTAIVRRAWDRDDLRSLTKNSPARATGAHIAIVGHVSKEELLRYLDRSELANGFANRFLAVAARRAQLLPDGDGVPEQALLPLAARLAEAREWARAGRVLRRDDEARAIWHTVYGDLSRDRPGMFGMAANRAEAQVVRLSVLCAALDCSALIRAEHLLAALAVWRYCEQSARWAFGDATGDPTGDAILSALRRNGELDRQDINDLLGRHVNRSRIDAALGTLLTSGLAKMRREATGGRPREVWRAV